MFFVILIKKYNIVGQRLFYYPNVKNFACRINKSRLAFPFLSAPISWHRADVSLCFPQVYYISKATLKVANKQYSKVNNDYEMTLHAHSSIVPCDDSHDIPTMSCDFVKIADLENRDKDAIIGERWGEKKTGHGAVQWGITPTGWAFSVFQPHNPRFHWVNYDIFKQN